VTALDLFADELDEERPSIQRQFEEFHAANPQVYEALRSLAFELLIRGHSCCGIGMLWEVLRWRSMMRTVGDDWKLNNNFRSRYARLLMANEPELADFFELRELRGSR